MKKRREFKPGTVVVFDPESFTKEFWGSLSEKERIKYYGVLGYGKKKSVFFVFLTEIITAPGHCVLVNLDNQQIETMRHTSDFRKVKEDEF
jgi:hypothetical protein